VHFPCEIRTMGIVVYSHEASEMVLTCCVCQCFRWSCLSLSLIYILLFLQSPFLFVLLPAKSITVTGVRLSLNKANVWQNTVCPPCLLMKVWDDSCVLNPVGLAVKMLSLKALRGVHENLMLFSLCDLLIGM
jgi:hypothetical protein